MEETKVQNRVRVRLPKLGLGKLAQKTQRAAQQRDFPHPKPLPECASLAGSNSSSAALPRKSGICKKWRADSKYIHFQILSTDRFPSNYVQVPLRTTMIVLEKKSTCLIFHACFLPHAEDSTGLIFGLPIGGGEKKPIEFKVGI